MSIETEIKNLVRIFPPQPIDPLRAFVEWGGTYPDAQRFRDEVSGKSWTELSPAFLEQAHDALVFLGPSAIADYLPAFLAVMLRRDRELDALPSFLLNVLTRGTDGDRFDARFAHLTAAQRQAVAEALAALEAEHEGTSRQRGVTEALDSHWRPFLGKGV
jgi:hypothetical protein